MPDQLARIRGLASKLEVTYATDPVIDELQDATQTNALEIIPLDGDFVSREIDRNTLGQEGQILVAERVLMNYNVEAAGAGTVDTPPAWAKDLLCCGFAETVNVGTDVAYNPVSAGFPSLWMEGNRDGVKHTGIGARGNFSFNWSTRTIPRWAFSMTGLYVPPVDEAIPVYDLTAFEIPLAVKNKNTPTCTLLGQTVAMESVSIDLQNEVEHRDVIGNEEVLIVDRAVQGQISFESQKVGTFDWWDAAFKRTTGPLQIVHGLTAGNIVQIDCGQVEISNPTYSESQGVLMFNCDMIIKPTAAGNDELLITTK